MRGPAAPAKSARPRSAAGRAREEDHALSVQRDVRIALDHPGLASAAPGVGGRYRRPHPLVQLAPEALAEPLFLLPNARIALGEQHLTMTGLHAQELDRFSPREWLDGRPQGLRRCGSLDYATRPGRPILGSAPGDAEHIHRAGAGAQSAEAVAHGLGSDLLSAPGGLERVSAQRELGGERGRVGAPRAV